MVGQHVEAWIDKDVLIIGIVVSESPRKVTIKEAHAFHHVWGASNGNRGKLEKVWRSRVSPVRSRYRHIVKECVARWEKEESDGRADRT